MNDVIGMSTYKEYEQLFDKTMQETAERFVVIGYLLKVARDTDILRESGYKSMSEFALKRYGLKKDITSRYIAINDRYSENGYSDRLDQRYKDFGYSKLAEMLTLPDVIIDQIGTDMTKEDIRMIKAEVAEEQGISDIEVMIEVKDEGAEREETLLEKVLYQIGNERPEAYKALWVAVNEKECTIEDLSDILEPSGTAIITCRILGTGRLMMSLKGIDENIQIIKVRSEEKEEYTWQALRIAIVDFMKKYSHQYQNWKSCWQLTYGKFLPKPEVAPVQPKKVTRSRKPAETKKPEEKTEEQIPGQMEVQDHPEMMPAEEVEEIKNYPELRTNAEELEKAVHEVFWTWEGQKIPKEELEVLLGNAKKLVKSIEELMEYEEYTA